MCPFAVGTALWQGHDGAWTLTTCVKGTFTLAHGRDALIAENQEPIGVDRYFAGQSASLYAPSDIVPYKPRIDVLVVGHAYAPMGRPVEALVARFSIGDVSKGVGIIGDRPWTEGPYGLEPAAPSPFTKMPLRYERAARAMSNPIGVDLAAPPIAGGRALPNLEALDDEATPNTTVGFGPISPAWSARKGLLRGAALDWVTQGGRGPIPEGFDFGFYNAAPRDQQVELLRQNAKIILENLHPEHARVETRLPPIRPKAFLIDRATQRGTDIALRCDTLWIDTDRSLIVVTWRGLTGVESGDPRALGTIAVAAELKGKEVRFSHIERLLREEGLTSADTESFAMSDVNPLNVRYDGVTLATIPQTEDDAHARSSSAPPAPAPPAPIPGHPVLRDAMPAPGVPWAPPPLIPTSPAPPVADETTNNEFTTQRLKTNEPALRAAIARVERDAQSEAAEFPTSKIGLRPPRAESAPRNLPPPPVEAIPPTPPPPPIVPDEETEAETARINLKPVQRALAASAAAAAATGTPAPPRPAMVSSPPRVAASRTEPLPPAERPAPPASVPRPAMVDHAKLSSKPQPAPPASPPPTAPTPAPPSPQPSASSEARSVSLEDYARIVVAVERGEVMRILARLRIDNQEMDRIRAHWAERVARDPRLADAIEEAVEAARWE